MTAAIDAVLVDMGGVVLSNADLAPQWQRLLGELLARELGGSPAAWARANQIAFTRSWHDRYERGVLAASRARGARTYWTEDARLWLREMCELVGIAPPAGARLDELAVGSQVYVAERIRLAALPGAVDGLRALRERGLALHLAAAGWSVVLDAYLRALGARELIGTPYGSDLVDAFKTGPHFYSAIVAHAGLDPTRTVVVDDWPDALDWARAAGLTTCLVPTRADPDTRAHRVIASLRELGELL